MMARVLFRIDPTELQSRLGVVGEDAIVEEVRKRVRRIGGIPRQVFKSVEDFDDYCLTVFATEHMNLYVNLRELDFFNIPSRLKYYVAPFSRPLVEVPRRGLTYAKAAPSLFQGKFGTEEDKALGEKPCYEYRFLSDEIALAVGTVIKNPEELKLLEAFGLKSQLAEAIVRVGGLMSGTRNSIIN